jgi:hypothetical protein
MSYTLSNQLVFAQRLAPTGIRAHAGHQVGAHPLHAASRATAHSLLGTSGYGEWPAMPEISLILLDLNGVLYDYDREARTHALASASGLSQGLIRAADLGVRFRGCRRCRRRRCAGLPTRVRRGDWLRPVRSRVGRGSGCRDHTDSRSPVSNGPHPDRRHLRRIDQQQSTRPAAFFDTVPRGCGARARACLCLG